MGQAQLRLQQLKKQIRIEVRNAQYALEQSKARVEFATKARDLARKTFDITEKEQELGAGSSYQTLTSRHDLAEAESTLVAAMTAYQKAKIELDRNDAGCKRAQPASAQSLDDMSLETVEAILIRKALARSEGNVSHAADALGLSRGALYRRMEKYGL
jgi:transcriptional regulator of acetoin/glycerol metabolism